MEKLIRVLEGITATLWAITILYSIFFFSLGGFLLNDIFQEILISLITGAISSLVFTSISYFAFLHKIPEKTYEKIEKLLRQHRTIAEASAVESPIRQETIGFPAHFFARAHNFKPPGRACQPEADSPMRT